LLIDVDHFKQVNDLRGHPVGDHVLRQLGSTVKRALRLEDVFARYGGEEFAIVSRSTDLAHGLLLAERIRLLVQNTTFDHEDHRIPITVSVGVACLADCGGELTPDRLIASADVALYRAKGGRSQLLPSARRCICLIHPTGAFAKPLRCSTDHIEHFTGGYESQLRTSFDEACRRLDLNLLLFVGALLASPIPPPRPEQDLRSRAHRLC